MGDGALPRRGRAGSLGPWRHDAGRWVEQSRCHAHRGSARATAYRCDECSGHREHGYGVWPDRGDASIRPDITVEQFGPIGGGSTRSWTDYAHETLEARRADARAAIGAGLGMDEVNSVLGIIEGLNEIECNTPSLCHGDISADHLFIDGSLELTGIIDFGMCQGGPGALDIAVLTMFHPDVRLEWLWSGYAPGEHVPANYPRHILALQTNVALTYLAHDFRVGNADSRPIVLAGLRSIIEQWHSSVP